jgi:hypothetical protein
VLLALLVVAVGAVFGGAAFAVEQHHTGPRVDVRRTADGWRISSQLLDGAGGGGHAARFSGLELAGAGLIWQDGRFIVLMDLESGRLRTIGPGPENRATWRPALSARYAVWFEGPGGSRTGDAYAYELSSGRRLLVAEGVDVVSYPSVSGATAVWTEAVGALPSTGEAPDSARLSVLDLSSGDLRALPADAGEPVVDEGLVAYRRWPSEGRGDELVALDLETGARVALALAGPGSGLGVEGWDVSGRRVAWQWKDWASSTARIIVRDVDSSAVTTVAAGAGLVGPALDGDLVVWAETSGDGARIMGRRLGEASGFEIATTSVTVERIAASGSVVAWMGRDTTAEGATVSVIETVRSERGVAR